jgi:hypothetical protein
VRCCSRCAQARNDLWCVARLLEGSEETNTFATINYFPRSCMCGPTLRLLVMRTARVGVLKVASSAKHRGGTPALTPVMPNILMVRLATTGRGVVVPDHCYSPRARTERAGASCPGATRVPLAKWHWSAVNTARPNSRTATTHGEVRLSRLPGPSQCSSTGRKTTRPL